MRLATMARRYIWTFAKAVVSITPKMTSKSPFKYDGELKGGKKYHHSPQSQALSVIIAFGLSCLR